MTYTPGERVTIPAKEYDSKPYDLWAEIADIAARQYDGHDDIRDSQEPHAQYLASLYLQTKYEDFCRGASTLELQEREKEPEPAMCDKIRVTGLRDDVRRLTTDRMVSLGP